MISTFTVVPGNDFAIRVARVTPSLRLGERISASPAITGGWLIYRADSHMYCIGGP
jgi:hypothetical protein